MTPTPQNKDLQRLTQWVEAHGSRVWGYLWASVRNADLADDLWQEVFRRACQAQETYDEQGYARAYLLKIADRLICDWARNVHREVTVDETTWHRLEPSHREYAPEHRLLHHEMSNQLQAAMKKLSDHQRRALLLRYYGELSFQEIAEQLHCPLNTALSHVRRGLEAMRGLLKACPK